MTKTMLTCRAAVTACAAVVLTAVLASCAGPTDAPSGNDTTRAAATSAPAPEGADGELTVGETPWWQLAATTPGPKRGPQPPPRHFVLSGGVLFEPNSPALTPGAGTQLGIILTQLEAHRDARVTVDGYTNADAGPERTAMTLSASRAGTVKAWFVANGIAAQRITTHGWGDSHPIYPHPSNDSERAANRRCEISVSGGTGD